MASLISSTGGGAFKSIIVNCLSILRYIVGNKDFLSTIRGKYLVYRGPKVGHKVGHKGHKVGPRLREVTPAARGSQEARSADLCKC